MSTRKQEVTEKVLLVLGEINQLYKDHNLTIAEGMLINHMMLTPVALDLDDDLHFDHGFEVDGIQINLTTMIKIIKPKLES